MSWKNILNVADNAITTGSAIKDIVVDDEKKEESDSRCKHRTWIITKLEEISDPFDGIITFTTRCVHCDELGSVTYKNAEEDFIQWDDDGK